MAAVDKRLKETSAPRPERVSDQEWHRALGARLRAFRIERGMSEEDAARVAGRSVQTWRKYERTGRVKCAVPLLAFARHVGIKLDALICDP